MTLVTDITIEPKDKKAEVVGFLNTQCYGIYNPQAHTIMFSPKSTADMCSFLAMARQLPEVFGFSCTRPNITIIGEKKIEALEAAGVQVDRNVTREFVNR